MKATPVTPATQERSGETGYRQGIGGDTGGTGYRQGIGAGTGYRQGEQRNNPTHDGQAISRLPTYSETYLTNTNTNQYPPQPYSPQNPQSSTGPQQPYLPYPSHQSRIVNYPATEQSSRGSVWRQCWTNPYQAELPGCSVQQYRGEVYNVCR